MKIFTCWDHIFMEDENGEIYERLTENFWKKQTDAEYLSLIKSNSEVIDLKEFLNNEKNINLQFFQRTKPRFIDTKPRGSKFSIDFSLPQVKWDTSYVGDEVLVLAELPNGALLSLKKSEPAPIISIISPIYTKDGNYVMEPCTQQIKINGRDIYKHLKNEATKAKNKPNEPTI